LRSPARHVEGFRTKVISVAFLPEQTITSVDAFTEITCPVTACVPSRAPGFCVGGSARLVSLIDAANPDVDNKLATRTIAMTVCRPNTGLLDSRDLRRA
jgi:hypothetical protein